jgi:hypothetical protein
MVSEKAGPQPFEVTTTNPDPSIATTTALLREITGSRELAQILVNFTREIVEAKLSGERDLLSMRVDHLENRAQLQPVLIKEAIASAGENVNEKLKVQDQQFTNVQVQFKERDTRQEQTTKDSSKAIDAAFTAADKAITKTETGFTKQIEEQGKRIDNVAKTIDDKSNDLKELIGAQKDRITVLESITRGASIQKTEAVQSTANIGTILAMVFGAIGFIVALGTLVISISKNSERTPPSVYLQTPAPAPAPAPIQLPR